MNSYFLQSALLPDGWHRNVRVTVKDGIFEHIELNAKAQTSDQAMTHVIAAMPNAHSHVFQRAMAGLSEFRSSEGDDFWSWRDLMYRLANRLDNTTLYAVAKACYTEMRQAGYASVCEFHYVHRLREDAQDFLTHSKTLLKAADEVGLPITFLPVLYAYAGAGEKPLSAEQRRFELSTQEYISLFKQLQKVLQPQQQLGICFHSLRAVNQQQMQQVLKALPNDAPVHIHIAEQQAEVEQTLKHLGQRPVAWLFDHFKVNKRWALVHATHLDDEEVQQLAKSGAVAVLCPLTEANLGDGIFPMPAYQAHMGRWAIGSDSHIEIKPQQELKMLEYSQRLKHQQRNVCCDQNQPHVATWMWLQALDAGCQASGGIGHGIKKGNRAAVIELFPEDREKQAELALDDWVFSDRTQSIAHLL